MAKSSPLTAAGSRLYAIATKARTAGFESGLLPIRSVEGIKIFSVGNLRAGGSGKTPFAMLLASLIRSRGFETALVLRGYRGGLETRGGFVSKGAGPLCSSAQAGDEAYMAALRLEGVSVLVGADRVASVRRARDAGAVAVVLDDGFQHRSLSRDFDILLACPEDLNPLTKLLPAGPLREPPFQASRADLIAGFEQDWRRQKEKPELLFEYAPTCLVLDDHRTLALSDHAGAKVFLLSGIARPDRFRHTAQSAGFTITGHRYFEDHHRFRRGEIRGVEDEAEKSGADAIVTTEKDLARLLDARTRLPLWAIRIDVKINSGFDLLEKEIDNIAMPATTKD